MKKLKMFPAALAVIVLSLFTGCSEQITSSGESDLNNMSVSETERQIDRPLFRTEIRLKPNMSYTFNSANTGLISFNSIKAGRKSFPVADDVFSDPCKDIIVLSAQKEIAKLSCNSSNFNLKEIVIMNTGSSMIDVDVVLIGEKYPVENPELE